MDGLKLQIDDHFPALIREFQQRRGKVRARVVDEHVDAAELLHAFVHASLPVIRVGQVSLNEADALSALLDSGLHLADVVGKVGNENVRARLGQRDCVDHAEAHVGAGDHDDLALAGEKVERE